MLDTSTANIVDALQPLAVDITTLTPLPGNPRIGDVAAIARSLTRFGQRKPITATADGVVTAGNHTLLAARSLGWDRIACVYVDDDATTANAWALADNRLAELASYDEAALLELIRSVDDVELLDVTGWGEDDIAELVGRIDPMSVLLDDGMRDAFGIYDRETICDVAFEHYRVHGFPYRRLSRLECLQQINALAATPSDRLASSVTAYHVADTYQPHRMLGHADGMRSPIESFADDDQLRRAFKFAIDFYGGTITDQVLFNALCLVAGTQACSNFRPGFALSLYREFAREGATVLDTSTGYGGRLVGFLASEASTYVGIDPSTLTHAGNERLVDELGQHKHVELINAPAEDVDARELAQRCDFAFTSPPYFTKEHYADEPTQSFKRYTEPTAWRDGFLAPMLELTHTALRAGCFALVNIADVDIKGVSIPLEQWTRECATACGFELVEVRRFPMPRAFSTNETRDAFEPVFVFRK